MFHAVSPRNNNYQYQQLEPVLGFTLIQIVSPSFIHLVTEMVTEIGKLW